MIASFKQITQVIKHILFTIISSNNSCVKTIYMKRSELAQYEQQLLCKLQFSINMYLIRSWVASCSVLLLHLLVEQVTSNNSLLLLRSIKMYMIIVCVASCRFLLLYLSLFSLISSVMVFSMFSIAALIALSSTTFQLYGQEHFTLNL